MEGRDSLLRVWAAWNDRAMEAHDTEDGIRARTLANALAAELGDFSEHDWGVIRNAQRGYLLVFDLESDDAPKLLGTYESTDDTRIAYSDTDGRLRHAPEDCVRVVRVKI